MVKTNIRFHLIGITPTKVLHFLKINLSKKMCTPTKFSLFTKLLPFLALAHHNSCCSRNADHNKLKTRQTFLTLLSLVPCKLSILHCILYTVYYTKVSVQCTVYALYKAVYTVQCIVYTTHCTQLNEPVQSGLYYKHLCN